MVRIPLIKRQPKSDSPQAEDANAKGKDAKSKDKPTQTAGTKHGKGTASPSSEVHYRGLQPPAGKDEDGGLYVLGTDKKIPLPGKSPKHDIMQAESPAVVEKTAVTLTLPESPPERQPAEAPFVARVILPESPPEAPEAADEDKSPVTVPPAEEKADEAPVGTAVGDEAPPPEPAAEVTEAAAVVPVDVAEDHLAAAPVPREGQPEGPAVTGVDREAADALAILRVMPDYLFRIGKDGVSPVPRDGSRAAAGASGPASNEKPTDGKVVAHEEDKPRPLEKTILEELRRQSEPYTRKALETKQLQSFEFQIRDGSEIHDLEARLMSLRESEVLALVRDVTQMKQAHKTLIESRNELEKNLKERNAEMMRVNKMLKTEVELREEQEEVLKKNFRKLESLLDDTIGAITLIVERRDPHVADHQRRVCQLACAIAQEMHSRNDRMRAVRIAAQLHDLGKTFIPAEILRKPGKLTEAEMSMVKTHPDTDYEILKRINFPISIADVVRQHHERMNGTGYPQGLKGDDILIEARIIAVADVVEGMIFERPYRVAPGLEAALKEIADNKGTLYDSTVVDTCLKLFAEKRFAFESMPGRVNSGGGESSVTALVGSSQEPDRRDL